MKKHLIALIFLIFVLLYSSALAGEILVGGWWNGTLDELQTARDTLRQVFLGYVLKVPPKYDNNATIILQINWYESSIIELASAISQLNREIEKKQGTNSTTDSYIISTPTPTPSPSPTPTPTPTPTPKPINRSSSSSQTRSFTNAYGTPTTICAHRGCNNYIASSGDTNCCTVHSRRCANCGKYIDEDATWCMSCITKAINSIK